MKRFIIERDIPKVGQMQGGELQKVANTSNQALRKLDGKVQWVESFVTDDKTFCVYLADEPESIREHAQLSGIPISHIHEVKRTIDPTVG
ncbi:DUF4242 domain-containing protein [Proteobacteria bacterium 005FR1]|nr:DUF4242 domain-containing protein [Proteobacteria bacterium 005FR1]